MTKDEAEAIHQLARQLLEEDCAVETRQRIARKIIEHARAIKASCMAEPVVRGVTTKVQVSPVVLTREQSQAQLAAMFAASVRRALSRIHTPANYG